VHQKFASEKGQLHQGRRENANILIFAPLYIREFAAF
jgi:hypothetical protein